MSTTGSDFASMLRQAALAVGATSADSVFAEEPVSLTIFVQDKSFLGNPPLSPVQYDAVRHIERIYYPATYKLLADEFEKGKKVDVFHAGPVSSWRSEAYWGKPVRLVNICTIQWGKGSIAPYVRIYNSRTGQWVKVKDWDQQDLVAAAYPRDGNVFATPGTAAFREGYGAMYRVRTSKGMETDVWEGHRFLSWARRRWGSGKPTLDFGSGKGAVWERLSDLQVGDPIAISSMVPEPTEPITLPDRDVELAALLIANGTVSGGHHGKLTFNADAVLAHQRAKELYEMFPNTEVDSYLDTSSGTRRWRVHPKDTVTHKYSSAVYEAVKRWGLDGSVASDKRIPDEFFSCSNRQIALFVSRLTDTDGWVCFSNTPEIGYSTTSKELALDVHRMWLRLGVLGELKEKKTTCQNCRRGDPDHQSPHISYQIRVRDLVGLETLATQLTLLDKDPVRLRILEWAEQRRGMRVKARHGDLIWDRIEEITYLGEGEYWTLSVDGPASYVSDLGVLHHNSGKDHVCRVASMRIAYLLMCLDSPQEYYGLPAQDTIHLLNVASSAQQAQQAFFQPITRAVKTGWFQGRCEPRQNVISYDKNIESISGHSDAETQEGLNLMLGIADEIDAFKSTKEIRGRRGNLPSSREPTKSVESILSMMTSSASTRFPEVFKNVRISYPRYLGSMIQQLTLESHADVKEHGIDSRHYVSGPLATWEVNPRVRGKEVFAADYREDPIMARSKYECRPARAVNPYFRNHIAVDACFVSTPQMPIEVGYVMDRSGGRQVWIPDYVFADTFFPVRGAVYAMHADLAFTGDRAGVALAHVTKFSEHETIAEDEDGTPHPVREVRPHVKVDFVISYSADSSADPPREIQIRWARQLCFELTRRGFHIGRLSFDSFQSLDSMQILEAKGIECQRLSTDSSEDPWRSLRDLMYEGRITIPRPANLPDGEPAPFLLRDELLSLTRLPNGRIDHPSDGCFVGETRIPLLDGTAPQIQDLVGREGVWVYSATPEGGVVPGWARARQTKLAHTLVDVVLDNGSVSRCTPEHLWMLRDGAYKAACDLEPGVDRLMPIKRTWPINGGYERITDKDGNRCLTHYLVVESDGTAVQPGEIVHHVNHVKTDNRPDNLQVMERSAHYSHHGLDRWATDSEYVQRVRDGHARWRDTPEAKEALARRDLSRCKDPFRDFTSDQRHEVLSRRSRFYRRDITLNSLRTVLNEDNANSAARALGCGRNVVIARLRAAGYETWDEYRASCDGNHKVRYVLPVDLSDPVPVYDLEVDHWHNFALLGGVFVHNSKDAADALACAAFGAVMVGGAEEEEGQRAHYSTPGIVVGHSFDLPLGTKLDQVWEWDRPVEF